MTKLKQSVQTIEKIYKAKLVQQYELIDKVQQRTFRTFTIILPQPILKSNLVIS